MAVCGPPPNENDQTIKVTYSRAEHKNALNCDFRKRIIVV